MQWCSCAQTVRRCLWGGGCGWTSRQHTRSDQPIRIASRQDLTAGFVHREEGLCETDRCIGCGSCECMSWVRCVADTSRIVGSTRIRRDFTCVCAGRWTVGEKNSVFSCVVLWFCGCNKLKQLPRQGISLQDDLQELWYSGYRVAL